MKISDIVALGFGQIQKNNISKGISELEDLGYNLFYIGKKCRSLYLSRRWAKVLL